MAATLEELWPGVEAAAPDDPGPLVVAADWCDENDQPHLAYALRWCAGRKRRPEHRAKLVRPKWRWTSKSAAGPGSREPSGLPAAIFILNKARWTGYVQFKENMSAYEWLTVQLANLRAIVSIPRIVLPVPVEVVRLGPVTCAQCGIMRSRDVLDCPVCKSSEVKT